MSFRCKVFTSVEPFSVSGSPRFLDAEYGDTTSMFNHAKEFHVEG